MSWMGRERKGKIKGRKGRTGKRSVYGGRQHESKGIHLQGVEAANQPISSEQRLSWKPGKHSVHSGRVGNLTASASLATAADGSPPPPLDLPNALKSKVLHGPTRLELVHYLWLEKRRKVTAASYLSDPLLLFVLSQHSPDLTASSHFPIFYPGGWQPQPRQWLFLLLP